MLNMQDFVRYDDDFIGPSVAFPTSANIATAWTTTLTGAATHVRAASEAVLTLVVADTNQIVGVSHGDALSFDIDDLIGVEMRVRIGAATFASGSILAFGVGSARNNTLDTVTANAWFRMEGANSTTQVYVETDDNVRDIDDVPTGVTLGTAYKKFYIDFSNGKQDVQFYIDGQRVARTTQFNMSGYSDGLQPIFQLQKPSGTNVDSVRMDYIRVLTRRA